jgi:hypothetical protein
MSRTKRDANSAPDAARPSGAGQRHGERWPANPPTARPTRPLAPPLLHPPAAGGDQRVLGEREEPGSPLRARSRPAIRSRSLIKRGPAAPENRPPRRSANASSRVRFATGRTLRSSHRSRYEMLGISLTLDATADDAAARRQRQRLERSFDAQAAARTLTCRLVGRMSRKRPVRQDLPCLARLSARALRHTWRVARWAGESRSPVASTA